MFVACIECNIICHVRFFQVVVLRQKWWPFCAHLCPSEQWHTHEVCVTVADVQCLLCTSSLLYSGTYSWNNQAGDSSVWVAWSFQWYTSPGSQKVPTYADASAAEKDKIFPDKNFPKFSSVQSLCFPYSLLPISAPLYQQRVFFWEVTHIVQDMVNSDMLQAPL